MLNKVVFLIVAFFMLFSLTVNAASDYEKCIARVNACNDRCDSISSSDYYSKASCSNRCARKLNRCSALRSSGGGRTMIKPGFRGYFGIGMSPAVEGGVFVNEVLPKTAAANANILPGDIILKVDGYNVDVPSFQQYIASKPGQIVRLTIVRFGQIIEGSVRIGALAND